MSIAEKTPSENSLEKTTIEQLPGVTSAKPSVKFHQEWQEPVITDTMRIREGIYKALYRIRNKLCTPHAIYLGHKWLRALDDLNLAETSYYGERKNTFCDIPIYEVVGQPYHFFVAIEEPER